jgi:hypothetical protein
MLRKASSIEMDGLESHPMQSDEVEAVMLCQNERAHEKLSKYERGSGLGVA